MLSESIILSSWQALLAEGFKSPDALLDYLGISPESAGMSELAHQDFRTKVPKGFADKMKPGDPDDPLLKQVLPVVDETADIGGYTEDPLSEALANPVKGLLHKYHGRVLLTLAEGCAINCRYCFRRHFDYKHNVSGRTGLPAMLEYIRADETIKEVILSGGDPLLLRDELLKETITAIETIETVKILRIHTRMPIVLPERVTPELVSILAHSRLKVVIVVHCNHPRELDHAIAVRVGHLRSQGIHVLNQTVLLRGVNDNPAILCELSESLFEAGILPYYLHMLDKVKGAQHFDLPAEKALLLYQEMRKKLPGYLLPRLVREIPGEVSKIPLGQ